MPRSMRGGSVFPARIKYAGRGVPARVVRALCGPGLNRLGRPALPPNGGTWKKYLGVPN